MKKKRKINTNQKISKILFIKNKFFTKKKLNSKLEEKKNLFLKFIILYVLTIILKKFIYRKFPFEKI